MVAHCAPSYFPNPKLIQPPPVPMTADQYTELIEFLAERFGRIDARFDALEGRVTGVEVGLEALRHDVQLVAEGQVALTERLERYHQDHEVRIRALEAHWFQA